MQIYITSFNNVRYFTDNIIPVSTAGGCGWPWWLLKSDKHKEGDFYLNSHNVMIGLQEKSLSFPVEEFEVLSEQCERNCPYKDKAPNCQFMISYYNYLKTQDFNKLLLEFERVSNEVKSINNYKDEPIIVLLVYEAADNPCGERPCLRRWFEDNGYELKEWNKDLLINEKDFIF